jgi:hypothetical protein
MKFLKLTLFCFWLAAVLDCVFGIDTFTWKYWLIHAPASIFYAWEILE